MKRLFTFLGLSVAGLLAGILLIAAAHAFLVSPRSDFASALGYTSGVASAALVTLPVATAVNIRISPLPGMVALLVIVTWIVCAVLSSRMPRSLAVLGAVLLPVVWVACTAR